MNGLSLLEQRAETLILVMTYRCNLRCKYCPTFKADIDTSKQVIDSALKRFIGLPQLQVVRFFGAEPLLARHLVFYTYQKAKTLLSQSKFDSLRFSLTTNGTLLDSEFLNFVAQQPNFELIVSADGAPYWHKLNRVSVNGSDSYVWIERWRSTLVRLKPPVGVNITISPSTASVLVENFVHLYKMGFRRFNFLPAYYVQWQGGQLKELRQSFVKLANLIGNMWKRGMRVLVQNMFVKSEETFFNPAIVVDTDGSVFATSAVLTARVRKYRSELCLGDVFSQHFHNPKTSTQEVVEKAFGKHLVEITARVDSLLTEFVELLWHKRYIAEQERGGGKV